MRDILLSSVRGTLSVSDMQLSGPASARGAPAAWCPRFGHTIEVDVGKRESDETLVCC